MKAKFILTLLVSTLFLALIAPFYMYFSYDVSVVNTLYPHLEKLNEEVQYVLRPERPTHWVKLKDVSRYGRGAIMLSEDWAFYQHEGVDLEQMKVALNEMYSGQRFRGASTITQQLVKNLFLSNERTMWRKFHEIILAHKMERHTTKDNIFELYLNCIEFGPNIYGISKAAKHYFNKSPSLLTPRESSFLAMLLPSPKRYYISFKSKKLTPFAHQRIKSILGKLRMGKIITLEQYEVEKLAKFSWEN